MNITATSMATTTLFFLAFALPLLVVTESFHIRRSQDHRIRILRSASNADDQPGLVVTLAKPLGMILEEVEEGKPKGVTVTGLREEGSAFQSEFKDCLVGLRLSSVMGKNVENMMFDDVMTAIIDAPSPVMLMLQAPSEIAEPPMLDKFPLGSLVAITVLNGDKSTVINATVGENLRGVLLDNNIEVYKGLKQKLGNW